MLVFYDSGIGGLSVLKTWLELEVPDSVWATTSNLTNDQNLVYLADTAVFPLGDKTPDQASKDITKSFESFLANDLQGKMTNKNNQNLQITQSNYPTNNQVNHQANYLILACNSASSLGLKPPKNFEVINIIDTTAEYLNFHHQGKKILILCTALTKKAGYLPKKLDSFGFDYQILATPLAKLIESYDKNLIIEELQTLKSQIEVGFKPDLVVLACTHYNFVEAEIREVFDLPCLGQDQIMARKLQEMGIYPNVGENYDVVKFVASGQNPPLSSQALEYLGFEVEPEFNLEI